MSLIGVAALVGIVLAAAGVLGFAFVVARPQPMLYCYLATLLFVSQGDGGQGGLSDGDIYGRGTGVLPVALITVYLWSMAAIAFARRRVAGRPLEPFNVYKYFWLFNILFAFHMIAAAWLGIPLSQSLSMLGLISVVNVSIFFYVLLALLDSPEDLRKLTKFFIICASIRGVYALIRFLFFGGDPSNPYALLEQRDVTITFANAADLAVASATAFWCAWQLTNRYSEMRVSARLGCLALLAMESSLVVFSAHRSSWAGFGLATMVFFATVPRRRRKWAALATAVFVAVAATAVAATAVKRFGAGAAPGASLVDMLLPDFKSTQASPEERGRPRELGYALDTILAHPIFGVGSWGKYEGWGIPWQQGENAYGFFHSALGNIALKGGILGLSLFLGMLFAPVNFTYRQRSSIPHSDRGIYYAGVAGLAYLLPTLLVEAGNTEVRTMQVLALLVALPYVVYRATRPELYPDGSIVPVQPRARAPRFGHARLLPQRGRPGTP